ncbi:hypothetical protein [Nonomuraea typhae]|uniref:hypothetical protein n=1 Tax=Nonomuraea typhae TaxID=2603600 RepID=UPI0015E2291D|nr:hypothetical protein [Nonomuraea typhae]
MPAARGREAHLRRRSAQREYYAVLGEVGRKWWSPHGSTLPWVRFCLRAHHTQAQRLREAEEVWALLEEQVDGLNPRVVSALYEVFVNRWLRRTPRGRFYAPGPRMAAIKAEFAERRGPPRDPYRSTG